MISNVDILPTLLEACGISVPGNIAGRSFLPLLAGGNYKPNEAVFAEKTFADKYDPRRCIRTERFKYIRYFELNAFSNIRAATIDRLHHSRIPWQRHAPELLYDLRRDPGERNDVAGDASYAEVLDEMRTRLAVANADHHPLAVDVPVRTGRSSGRRRLPSTS